MPKTNKINMKSAITVKETFKKFLTVKKAAGLSDKTLKSYGEHFRALEKILDTNIEMNAVSKEYFSVAVSALRDRGLRSNSIRSYTRTLKSFLGWCNTEGITLVNIPLYKAEETIKETYTDMELEILLKKPNMKNCNFCEYRNWTIINFLLNSGCRAATIRNIKNKDADIYNAVVYFRHNKNKKMQMIPLCSIMIQILTEYMKIRGGKPDDYLFPNDCGDKMTEGALASAIRKYNHRRGVSNGECPVFRVNGIIVQ